MKKAYNIQGQELECAPKDKLIIVWGKAFGEIYCHHAVLYYQGFENSLFNDAVAKVIIGYRYSLVNKDNVTHYDNSHTCFLPCKICGSTMEVCLNSPELLRLLCLDSWTRKKDGSINEHKEFPLYMSLTFNDRNVSFDFSEMHVPALMAAPFLEILNDNELFELTIGLEI